MTNEQIIKSLLKVIDDYQKDGLSKELILSVEPIFDTIKITKLVTSGSSFKNTPFYFESLYTCIIVEEWANNDIIWASNPFNSCENKIKNLIKK